MSWSVETLVTNWLGVVVGRPKTLGNGLVRTCEAESEVTCQLKECRRPASGVTMTCQGPVDFGCMHFRSVRRLLALWAGFHSSPPMESQKNQPIAPGSLAPGLTRYAKTLL